MADFISTIVPYVLLAIGIIWLWSTFHDPAVRFFTWLKGFFASNRDRFQSQATGIKELTYS